MVNEALLTAINALHQSKPVPPPTEKDDSVGAVAGQLAGNAVVPNPGPPLMSGLGNPPVEGHDPNLHPPLDDLYEAHHVAEAMNNAVSGGTSPLIETPTLQHLLEAHQHVSDLHDFVKGGGDLHPAIKGMFDGFGNGPVADPTIGKDSESMGDTSGTPVPVDPNSIGDIKAQIDNLKSNPTALPQEQRKNVPLLLRLAEVGLGLLAGSNNKSDPHAGERVVGNIESGISQNNQALNTEENRKYQTAEQTRQGTIQSLEGKANDIAKADALARATKQQDIENDFTKQKLANEAIKVHEDAQAKAQAGLKAVYAGNPSAAVAEARMGLLPKEIRDNITPEVLESFKKAKQLEDDTKNRAVQLRVIEPRIQQYIKMSQDKSLLGSERVANADFAIDAIRKLDPEDERIPQLEALKPDLKLLSDTERRLKQTLKLGDKQLAMDDKQIALLADKVKYFDQDEQAKMASIYSGIDRNNNAQALNFARFEQTGKNDDFNKSLALWDKSQNARKSVLGHLSSRVNSLRAEQAKLLETGRDSDKAAAAKLSIPLSDLEGQIKTAQDEIHQATGDYGAGNPIGKPVKPGITTTPPVVKTQTGVDEKKQASDAIARHPDKKAVIIAEWERRHPGKKWGG